MRIAVWGAILVCGLMSGAWAKGEKAGEFDYYVLALSWSPNWCAIEGRAKESPQCDGPDSSVSADGWGGSAYGWVMHGLWPQFHQGWPSYCPTSAKPASRSMTGAMVDIMGSSGSAWHQWKKHGTCSGLTAVAFFELARDAYNSITRPQILRELEHTVTLPAQVIEDAFLTDNPQLAADMITITCRSDHIQEARICLSKTLDPVPCGRDVSRDCTMKDAIFRPLE